MFNYFELMLQLTSTTIQLTSKENKKNIYFQKLVFTSNNVVQTLRCRQKYYSKIIYI